MTLAGNLPLGFAVLFLLYPEIPDLPRVRAAIMRSNYSVIGPIYVLLFMLMPRFLRRLLATLAVWGLLAFALVEVIRLGGLDWLGVGRLAQGLLAGSTCGAMAELSVLIGLSRDDPDFSLPAIVHVVSPWAGWVLPLIVAGYALVGLNPELAGSLAPWVVRGPLVLATLFALPVGAVLLARWFTPPVAAASLVA